ncbi:MAG: nucleotidyl transferase AbiEii/AbiGii toxin family protein [Candidatus Omnitrophica bacterium]|nr:nucleotidyl transferase AbiEii/AbiGii toxin family protein [Candidatus Omnitrophota bacterium]
MWDLSRHEKIEMAILDGLHSRRILERLIFCGGTMLRLCHELNRYSVDLDFWFTERAHREELYEKTQKFLGEAARLKKSCKTENMLTFEFAVPAYARALKCEYRYREGTVACENKIAFSKNSNSQVLLRAATLEEMMNAKIQTFLDRVQIRDAFDIEFLMKRGIAVKATKEDIARMLTLLGQFKPNDYKVALGSLLDFKEREYYRNAKFSYLVTHLEMLLPQP